jgi:hypothetical protein
MNITFGIYCPLYVKFSRTDLQFITLSNLKYCKNRSRKAINFFQTSIKLYLFVQMYDALEAKNTYVKSVYHVTLLNLQS